MKINFLLSWIKSARSGRDSFKNKNSAALFEEYRERISHFAHCESIGWDEKRLAEKTGKVIWVCDRMGKEISSEELAAKLDHAMNSSAKEIDIVIGGPDGLNPHEIDKLKPAFVWSFGKMTLPHELAAVVASEQIYRAWSILRNLPYHKGH